jgi:hypothetical protein
MKKLLLILLCLPMMFSSCKEEGPVLAPPPAAPPACCIFSGTITGATLIYNPTWVGGVMCNGSTVSINQNGDIVDISLQFLSICVNAADKNWEMIVGLNSAVNNQDPIISGQTYNLGNPCGNSILASFVFTNWNCNASPTTYLMDIDPNNQSGTVTFDVDWANNEIGGTFTLTGEDSLGLPKTVSCTFSGLPFLMK